MNLKTKFFSVSIYIQGFWPPVEPSCHTCPANARQMYGKSLAQLQYSPTSPAKSRSNKHAPFVTVGVWQIANRQSNWNTFHTSFIIYIYMDYQSPLISFSDFFLGSTAQRNNINKQQKSISPWVASSIYTIFWGDDRDLSGQHQRNWISFDLYSRNYLRKWRVEPFLCTTFRW